MRPLCVATAALALAWIATHARAQNETNRDRPGASLEDRIGSATKAIGADPADQEALDRRASLYAAAGKPELAIADYDRLLKLDPTLADAFDARGSEHFKLGHIDESLEDFDRAIQLRPEREPWHWKRGISYYYAGRYADGRKQFEGYQTVDDNDVENAVWRYLCMARDQGVKAARRDMLKIKPDPRVGMMAVYALYSGHAKPEDVLAAARSGSPTPEQLNARLFYAHLYLGLYWDSLGDADQAKQHMAKAVAHKISHYMWNVADVHVRRLNAAAR
jgi:lipoprotein NlpI